MKTYGLINLTLGSGTLIWKFSIPLMVESFFTRLADIRF
jgi:hypothetical protein